DQDRSCDRRQEPDQRGVHRVEDEQPYWRALSRTDWRGRLNLHPPVRCPVQPRLNSSAEFDQPLDGWIQSPVESEHFGSRTWMAGEARVEGCAWHRSRVGLPGLKYWGFGQYLREWRPRV